MTSSFSGWWYCQKPNHREHFVKSEEGKAKGEKSFIPSLSSLISLPLSPPLCDLSIKPISLPHLLTFVYEVYKLKQGFKETCGERSESIGRDSFL